MKSGGVRDDDDEDAAEKSLELRSRTVGRRGSEGEVRG